MIAAARQIAYRILLQVSGGRGHSDELLRSPEVDALSAQDRALATTLVLGTLRWYLALDERIRALLARPEAKLSSDAATALRMGAFQLLYLDRVPAYAVIHDSVELVKQSPERGTAGMVNAILRRIGREAGNTESADPEARRRAERVAHPGWMVERWVQRYGPEAAQAICRWDQEPASMALRLANPELKLEGFETEPGALLQAARKLMRGDVGAAIRSGSIRVQDEASQLVAEIAAAAVPGARQVLDTCAAPGSKTAILTERLPQAQITAVDVSCRRLASMKDLLSRQPGITRREEGKSIRFELADAAALQLQPEYDLILCDMPCTGTGTMGRNPEIRLRIDEAEIHRQQSRQRAILRSALAGLRPGGRLVYSTCSLEPEENEAVIDPALAVIPGLRLVPAGNLLDRLAESGIVSAAGRDRLRGATDAGCLRTIPGVHPCDGFFAAVLEKN